jgi:hypothetical protein
MMEMVGMTTWPRSRWLHIPLAAIVSFPLAGLGSAAAQWFLNTLWQPAHLLPNSGDIGIAVGSLMGLISFADMMVLQKRWAHASGKDQFYRRPNNLSIMKG